MLNKAIFCRIEAIFCWIKAIFCWIKAIFLLLNWQPSNFCFKISEFFFVFHKIDWVIGKIRVSFTLIWLVHLKRYYLVSDCISGEELFPARIVLKLKKFKWLLLYLYLWWLVNSISSAFRYIIQAENSFNFIEYHPVWKWWFSFGFL